jgi:hypothetical protein
MIPSQDKEKHNGYEIYWYKWSNNHEIVQSVTHTQIPYSLM